MSIGEYIAEGGFVPGMPGMYGMFWDEYDGSRLADEDTQNRRKAYWSKLCNDPRWKYVASGETTPRAEICCGQETDRAPDDYWGAKATWKAAASAVSDENMHPGALAPRWVWESTPTTITSETDETYLERLICVLTGRFVCLGLENNGIPLMGERYRWRYWNNQGNVYQDHGIKWSSVQGHEVISVDSGSPGAFEAYNLWMFCEGSINREFWDAMWWWKYEGSSSNEEWDQCLSDLASEAGFRSAPDWPLNKAEIDTLASEKGWTEVACTQPAMASYRKDDQRINVYLSTGTVGTCLDHPTQGKTQLFRRSMDMNGVASLLDNLRQHTGRGYKRKASSEPLRTCANCGSDKPNSEFSKNQKRKGASAKCIDCAQSSRR